mgnify:CR=1 FL=1
MGKLTVESIINIYGSGVKEIKTYNETLLCVGVPGKFGAFPGGLCSSSFRDYGMIILAFGKIIELINNIDDLGKLKMIYQFIRGLLSS